MATSFINVEQMTALIEFMESCPELALGHLGRSKEGRSQGKHLWKQCTAVLNNVTPGCVQKTDVQWRMYFNEYKSKLYKKIKEIAEIQDSEGELKKKIILTPLQQRLYNILEGAVEKPLSNEDNDSFFSKYKNLSTKIVPKIEQVTEPSSAKKFKAAYEDENRSANRPSPSKKSSSHDDISTEEFDLYCTLLVKKLKNLNEQQREVAMHEIDNVIYRIKMLDFKHNSYITISPIHKTEDDEEDPIQEYENESD